MANFVLIDGSLINLEYVAWAEMNLAEEDGYDQETLVLHFGFSKTDGQGKTHTYTVKDTNARLLWDHIMGQKITVLRPWHGSDPSA